jgi:hypothetical protein
VYHGSILGKNGKIIAILGIDMNAKGEFNLLRKLRIIIAFVIILSIILSFLAGAADWGERLDKLEHDKEKSNKLKLIYKK